MAVPHTFGSWLRQQRRRRHLTQAALGEMVNCATVTIKKIEGEQRRPSAQMATRLAECLNVPLDGREAFVRAARSGQAPVWSQKTSGRPALPAPRNAFFGREAEQSRLAELLIQPDIRLVTLVGPPGVGKTRLALQAAWSEQTVFDDGVYWVDLAPLTEAADILETACRAAGLAESTLDPLDLLANWMASRSALFVLDNCEQLKTPAGVIAELLDRIPRLSLLLTSRIPMDVYGEVLFPVAPLPVGKAPAGVIDLDDNPALALFKGRACEVQPMFNLNAENIQAVTDICRELDGLPLAIELAARQLRHSTLADIEGRIDQRLELLKQGPLDWRPRHQTFRAAIEWSVALLSAQEQRDFARIGVFSGGFTAQAAQALASEDSLHSLLDASLVQRSGDERYSLLQTVRDYALESLDVLGDACEAYRAHARYFRDLAVEASAHQNTPEVAEWQQRLALEQANLRAALEWCSQNEPNLGLELAAGMWRLWYQWGQYRSGVKWLRQFLQLAPERTHTRARALRGMGVLLLRYGEFDELLALFTESLEIARKQQDEYQTGSALMGLGDYYNGMGRFDMAGSYYEQALELFEASGDPLNISWAMGGLSEVAHYHEHDLAKSRSFMARSIHYARLANAPRHLGWVLGVSADLETIAGERQRARSMLKEAQELLGGVGDSPGVAYTLLRLGALHLHTGQHRKAVSKLEGAMHLGRQTYTRSYEAQAMCLLGVLAILREDYSRGVDQCAQAVSRFRFLRERLLPADVELMDEALQKAEGALGSERFKRLFGEDWQGGV